MYDISFIEPSLLPRERLVSEGVDKLSHQELLSILLRTGNKQKSVYEIAQGLLSSVNKSINPRGATGNLWHWPGEGHRTSGCD